MATSLLLEGDDPEALLERAQVEGGPRARIVRMGKVRQGGVMGFFAKERYEVAVEIPDDAEGPALEGRPSNDALLSSLGERQQTPFEQQLTEREDAERRMNLPSQRPATEPERLRPAYGPAAAPAASRRPAAPQVTATAGAHPTGPLPGAITPVSAVPARAAAPVAPVTAVAATPAQPSVAPLGSRTAPPSYAQVQEQVLNRRHEDLSDAEAPALARHGLLDIVDRVNAVERAATRAVAGQPLGEPEGVQFSLPLPRPSTGARSDDFSLEHEHEQIAASAAFAAGYARAHTGTAEEIMTDDVAALAALRRRPFEMATFPAASLGHPLAPADARSGPDGEPQQAAAPESAPEPVVTTIDDLTVRVDSPGARRQSTPWDDDPAEVDGPVVDAAEVDDTETTMEIPVVAATEAVETVPEDLDQELLMTPELMTIEQLLPQQMRPLSPLAVESIEAEAAAAVRLATEQAAEQARAEAAAEAAHRQAELEALVQAQARALAAVEVAQADTARREAEQLARHAIEAAERAGREAVEAAARATREAVEAAERTAFEALQTAERLAAEAREATAEQTRTVAELISQREEAAAAAAVRAERERISRDAARYWPGQAQPALATPQRQPLPVGRAHGNDLVDPVTGEATATAWNDTQVLQDRARLRDLGVPVAWTRRLRSGDRLSSVLRMLDGLPQSDVDRTTPVVAVVGPAGGVQFEAHRLALDLHVGNRPRPVVVVPARGTGRVAAMATVHRLETCIVALECDDEGDLAAVLEAFEVVQPSAVVAMVDASLPISATQEWLDALQTVDLVTVDGATEAAQPAAVLRLGLPVLRLDGTIVDRTAWAALLTARLEADEPDPITKR